MSPVPNKPEASTLPDQAAKDHIKQQRIAARIDDALSLLRQVARTNDFFSGYSLAEAIAERLNVLGAKEDDGTSTSFYGRRRTLIGRLNYLQEMLVGEDGKGGALGEALSVDALHELIDVADESEAGP